MSDSTTSMTTAELEQRCTNAAVLLGKLTTTMGRIKTWRIGNAAANELARRGLLAPEAWESASHDYRKAIGAF